MSHSKGLKTDRSFYKHNGKPYDFVGFSEDKAVLQELTGEGLLLVVDKKSFVDDFESITPGEVFDFIDNNNDEQHADMMSRLGIGYICPFCGGYLAWESDFMASEVHGLEGGYVEITDKNQIEMVEEHEAGFASSGILGYTEDIGPLNEEVECTGEYDKMYMIEEPADGDKSKRRYFQINDTVIGIYRCMNCGKSYEIQDCLPSDESDYPYFQ